MLRCCALIFSLCCFNAFAQSNHIIIFGDSMADEGRLYEMTQQAVPPAPYYEGRFSDGPTWPEYAFEARENYAVAGAKSDYTNYLAPELGELVDNTGLLGQVDDYLDAHPVPEENDKTLFYISIGANDILALSTEDDAAIKFLITGMLQNIKLAMHRLEGSPHKVALIGLPDLAVAPVAKDMSTAERALLTSLSDRFNEGLILLATRYRTSYIDMDAFTTRIMKRPQHYGFTNVTDACYNAETQVICDNPSEYFFWDDKHPSTRVHEMFAETLR